MHHILLSHALLVSVVLELCLVSIESIFEIQVFASVDTKLFSQSLSLLCEEVKIFPGVFCFSNRIISLTICLTLLLASLLQLELGFCKFSLQLGYSFHRGLILLIQLHESVFVFLFLAIHLASQSIKSIHLHILIANLFGQ